MRLRKDESIAKTNNNVSVQTLHHDYKNDVGTQHPSSCNDVSIQTNLQLKPKINRNSRSVKSFLQRVSTTMMDELQMSFIVSDAFQNQQLLDTDDEVQYCNNNNYHHYNNSLKHDDNKIFDGNTNEWKLNGMCLSLDGTIIATIYGNNETNNANNANNGMIRMESVLTTNNSFDRTSTPTSTPTSATMEYDCSLTCIASLPTKATKTRNHHLFVVGCETGELVWIKYDPFHKNGTTKLDILYSTPFGRYHVDSITSLQYIPPNSKDDNDNEYHLISTSIDGLLLVWDSGSSISKKNDSSYPIYGYRINHCISTLKIIQNYATKSILLIIASCNGTIYQGTLSSSSSSPSSSYSYTISTKKKKDKHSNIPTKFKWTTNAKHYIGSSFQETKKQQESFIQKVEEYAQRSSSFCHSDAKNIIINTKVIFDSNVIEYPNISLSLQEFPSPHIGTIVSLSSSTSIYGYPSTTTMKRTKSFANHHLSQNGIMICSYGTDGFLKVYKMMQHSSDCHSHYKPLSIQLMFSLDTMIQHDYIDTHTPMMSLSSSSYGIILPNMFPLVSNI